MSRLPRHGTKLALVATLIGLVFTGNVFLGRSTEGTARLAALDLNRLMTPATLEALDEGAVALSDAPTVLAWIWETRAIWTPVPSDVAAVRALLPPRSMALFTRAGGQGDDLDPETVRGYIATGGQGSASRVPLTVSWPDTLSP